MAMSKISLRDKRIVMDRLAEGKSYSQAMEKTAIKSKDTVHRIAKQESNAIERKRQQYLKKIKKYGANDNRRAKMWAQMTTATKRVCKEALIVPDWQARAVALKYIDELANLDKADEMKLEVNDTTPLREVSEQEKKDFNEAFKKFIMQQ